MKNFKRNRNVQASEDLIKSITDRVVDYLGSIGFEPYAYVDYTRILCKPIAPEINNSLYLFLKRGRVRIYQGIRTGNRIAAHHIHEGSIYELPDIMGLLAERNYL